MEIDVSCAAKFGNSWVALLSQPTLLPLMETRVLVWLSSPIDHLEMLSVCSLKPVAQDIAILKLYVEISEAVHKHVSWALLHPKW